MEDISNLYRRHLRDPEDRGLAQRVALLAWRLEAPSARTYLLGDSWPRQKLHLSNGFCKQKTESLRAYWSACGQAFMSRGWPKISTLDAVTCKRCRKTRFARFLGYEAFAAETIQSFPSKILERYGFEITGFPFKVEYRRRVPGWDLATGLPNGGKHWIVRI